MTSKLKTPNALAALAVSLCVLMSPIQAQPTGKKEFTFRGKVEQVDASARRLTVSNERIEGWMDAMTMLYRVDNPEVLTRLKRGDQIKAKVYEGDITLYEIEVIPPANVPAAPKDPSGLKLEDLERMALENNPTLKQATFEVQAASGRAKQAGLYPNPIVSMVGSEISAGPIIRGGEIGGGFSQRIVTGGKLGLSRRIGEQDRLTSEHAAEAQRYRVLNAIRSLYYQALADQRLVQVRAQLARLAQDVVRISSELGNVGQADKPDMLSAEIEAQRLELGLTTARNALERTWRQISAVVNNPALRPTLLEGDLENVPKLDADQALEKIFSESPELRIAEAETTRSEMALKRARRDPLPDIIVSGGVRYNRELLEQSPGGTARRPVGIEGYFDIGVQIPIFNRNQGTVSTAKADAERARLEVDRTKLALRMRMATVYREYQDAMATIERYRTQMIPRAQQSYDLYLKSFQAMAASYPQVLIAQRNLFQLQEEYITTLVAAWQRSIEINGMLLSDVMQRNATPRSGAMPVQSSSSDGGND